MARIRSIKPEFFVSQTLAKVSLGARLTFVGLWTEADDEGRLVDSAKMLAGSLFPHDDDIDAKTVDGWLEELVGIGVISRYTAGDGRYLCVNRWTEHQRVPHARASTLPEPPKKTNARRMNGSRTAPAPCRPEREQGKGKGSAQVKSTREPELDAAFEACWSRYPKKLRKPEALKAYRARRKAGIEASDLLRATENYARKVERERTEPKYVMFGATFYGPNDRWREHLEAEPVVALYDTTSYGSPV